jgi:hypothetical protein
MARYLIGNGEIGAWLFGPETMAKCQAYDGITEDHEKSGVYLYDSKNDNVPLQKWEKGKWSKIEVLTEPQEEIVEKVDNKNEAKLRDAYKLPTHAKVIHDSNYARYKANMKILGNKDEDVKRVALIYIEEHSTNCKINFSGEMEKVIIVIPESIKDVRRIELH